MRHAFLCKEFKMQNADIFLLSIFLLSIFPSQIFLSFVFNLGLRAKPALGSSVSICGSNCHPRNVVNGYDKSSHETTLLTFADQSDCTTLQTTHPQSRPGRRVQGRRSVRRHQCTSQGIPFPAGWRSPRRRGLCRRAWPE